MDQGQLEGLGLLAAGLAAMLKDTAQHQLQRCACYKEKGGP